MSKIDLSVVIPLFNEEEVFPQLIERLYGLLNVLGAQGTSAQIILVDDGSTDQTPVLIRKTCLANASYRGIILSRNFGHQLAITAGMAHATGEAVAILDGDLQDPPEVILEFYAKLKDGLDVVYAVRHTRTENIFKRCAYAAFDRLMRHLATVPIPLDSGDFCIMSRRVVREINAMQERH